MLNVTRAASESKAQASRTACVLSGYTSAQNSQRRMLSPSPRILTQPAHRAGRAEVADRHGNRATAGGPEQRSQIF